MKRLLPLLGWMIATAYFSLLALTNIVIVVELYRVSEGPWPGWLPMIEADLLYGGGGILALFGVKWIWNRMLELAI